MVFYYSNKSSSQQNVRVKLKQDTSKTQSGAQQTRIGSSSYEGVEGIKSISFDENNSLVSDKDCFKRDTTYMHGRTEVSGQIEFDTNVDLWTAINLGCEFYYKDASDDYHYVALHTGNEYVDSTATSFTLANGDVLTRYNVQSGTGRGWIAGQATGYIYLPQGPPYFYMKVEVKPNTADAITYYFTEEEILYYRGEH